MCFTRPLPTQIAWDLRVGRFAECRRRTNSFGSGSRRTSPQTTCCAPTWSRASRQPWRSTPRLRRCPPDEVMNCPSRHDGSRSAAILSHLHRDIANAAPISVHLHRNTKKAALIYVHSHRDIVKAAPISVHLHRDAAKAAPISLHLHLDVTPSGHRGPRPFRWRDPPFQRAQRSHLHEAAGALSVVSLHRPDFF